MTTSSAIPPKPSSTSGTRPRRISSPACWPAIDGDPIEPVTLKLRNGSWVKVQDRRARDGDLVCLAIDITEQMRIWAAIDVLPDGFVLFDREERLLACNQRYRDMFPDSAPGATRRHLRRPPAPRA
jgi:hypothetical protein